jgi:hypothetical protein
VAAWPDRAGAVLVVVGVGFVVVGVSDSIHWS